MQLPLHNILVILGLVYVSLGHHGHGHGDYHHSRYASLPGDAHLSIRQPGGEDLVDDPIPPRLFSHPRRVHAYQQPQILPRLLLPHLLPPAHHHQRRRSSRDVSGRTAPRAKKAMRVSPSRYETVKSLALTARVPQVW
ncbi:hypothetical protein F4778DRAFT_12767 [Xylariomycetidae sp. FL2044]|nr:hypothetical protein F4778DRAFT_12767 [Xylariomycetidae sp. FL2044]